MFEKDEQYLTQKLKNRMKKYQKTAEKIDEVFSQQREKLTAICAEQDRIEGKPESTRGGQEANAKAQMEKEDIAMSFDRKPEENSEIKIFVKTYLKGASGAEETIEI